MCPLNHFLKVLLWVGTRPRDRYNITGVKCKIKWLDLLLYSVLLDCWLSVVGCTNVSKNHPNFVICDMCSNA